MSRPQKRYSREHKIEVVRRIQESGRTQAEVAKELGIATNTVSRWVRQYRSEKTEAFPGKGSQTSQNALISRLRRENERPNTWRQVQRWCWRTWRCGKRRPRARPPRWPVRTPG